MTDRPGSEYMETLVIGGGQSGLVMGYHLSRRGLPYAIIDANDRIGDAWRNRWDSLRLFTPNRLNGLPGMPFPRIPLGVPEQRRDGRLSGVLRPALRYSRRDRCEGGETVSRGRPLRGDCRKPTV